MTIEETQREIMDEFGLLEGDREMSVMYLIDLGQKLPAFPEDARIEGNLVKGCQSKVWLTASVNHGRVYFTADSNTAVTKGLVSLLIRIFNGHLPDDIMSGDLFFMQKIGMDRFIGTQRSNGFASMIQRMKQYASALKTATGIQA
jgi:cysteine desulfuration protein SufE